VDRDPRIEEHPYRAQQNVGDFVDFKERKWKDSEEAVPFTGRVSFSPGKVENLFTVESENQEVCSVHLDYASVFRGIGLIQVSELDEDVAMDDLALVWLDLDEWLSLLCTPNLAVFLGAANAFHNERLLLCEGMRSAVDKLSGNDLARVLSSCAEKLVCNWGLTPLRQPSNNTICVSLREAIGFLASWSV
jgi:hypothetical protein